MDADRLKGGTRQGGGVLGSQPPPHHRDGHHEDSDDDADRVAERVADGRVGVPRDARRRVEGGRRRQRSREQAGCESGRQAEDVPTDERDQRTHETHDRRESQEARLLAQVLEERRTGRNADRVDEEREAHGLDDRHVGTHDLGMHRRHHESNEEGACGAESQRTDPDGANGGPERYDKKERKKG